MIDPRTIPVVGVDHHLPPVSPQRCQPEALRERFRAPPIWVPEVRQEPRFTDRPSLPAAVLIPVVMRAEPTVLLTQRTAHLPTHAGQVAFPGGKIDADDADAVAAALREAQEEVGLWPDTVEVLGALPEYVTGTAFVVTPVVALVDPGHTLQPNPHEVAEAFEVPLAFLMNPAHHRRHEMLWEGRMRQWFSMPYHDGGSERFIWGATAGMVRNLYRLLSA